MRNKQAKRIRKICKVVKNKDGKHNIHIYKLIKNIFKKTPRNERNSMLNNLKIHL